MLHSPTAPVTQRPTHPPHHTHTTPVTVRHSQSPTAPLASLLGHESHSRLLSVASLLSGAAAGTHRLAPKELHTRRNTTHPRPEAGKPRNPHGVARVQTGAHTQTHAHEAGYKGPHACETREGTTRREESDRIRLARARLQDGTHGRTGRSRLWRSFEARTAWTGPRCEFSQLTSRGRGSPAPGLESLCHERACACALRAQPTGFRLWTTFPRSPRGGWCKLPPGGPLAVRTGCFSYRG